MSLSVLVQPFLDLPLFRGLSGLQMTEIVRRAGRQVFRPGDTIVAENQIGDAAFLIVSGEAVRINAESADVGKLNERIPEGTLVGELAMLVETVHSTTILARTTVKALRLGREDLHEAMLADPTIAHHFSAKLTERLNAFALEFACIDRNLAAIAESARDDEAFSLTPAPVTGRLAQLSPVDAMATHIH